MPQKTCVECNARVIACAEGDRAYPELTPVVLRNVEITLCENGHERVRIPNPRGLMRTVARQLVRKRSVLTGKEFFCLRTSTGLIEPEQCANIIGFSSDEIVRWETRDDPVQSRADCSLRTFSARLLRCKFDEKKVAHERKTRPISMAVVYHSDARLWLPTHL